MTALGAEADLQRLRAIAARKWWERNGEDTLDGMLIALRWLPVLELTAALREALAAERAAHDAYRLRHAEVNLLRAAGDNESTAEDAAEASDAADAATKRAIEALIAALGPDSAVADERFRVAFADLDTRYAAEVGVGRECGCIEGNDMSLTTCAVVNCPVHGADAPHCGRCGTPRQAGATLNIEVDGRHFDELCEPCMRVAKRCLVCFGAHAGSFSRVDGGVRCGRCGHVAPDSPAPVTAQDAVVDWTEPSE